jgi:peptidase M23-like protein
MRIRSLHVAVRRVAVRRLQVAVRQVAVRRLEVAVRRVAARRLEVAVRRVAVRRLGVAVVLGLAGSIMLAAFPEFAAAAWRPPVPGAVTRGFDPGRFEAGRHRGVDLAATPGEAVRAPCAGVVAFAGAVGTSPRVVTLSCGRWRVTHMPLASIAVRAGVAVGEGALLGTVAPSRDHHGLHLGVRRDGTRFGYADPLRFLATAAPAPPPLGRAPRPARRRRTTPGPPPAPPTPRPAAPRPVVTPRPTTPRPTVAPGRAAAPSPGSNPGGGAPVAPWPVWLGLALVLAGVGVRWRGGGRGGTGWLPARQRQPVR